MFEVTDGATGRLYALLDSKPDIFVTAMKENNINRLLGNCMGQIYVSIEDYMLFSFHYVRTEWQHI